MISCVWDSFEKEKINRQKKITWSLNARTWTLVRFHATLWVNRVRNHWNNWSHESTLMSIWNILNRKNLNVTSWFPHILAITTRRFHSWMQCYRKLMPNWRSLNEIILLSLWLFILGSFFWCQKQSKWCKWFDDMNLPQHRYLLHIKNASW